MMQGSKTVLGWILVHSGDILCADLQLDEEYYVAVWTGGFPT